MAPDDEPDAQEAEQQLRRGLDKSRRLIADYRRRLARLAPAAAHGERPLFRWRKD